MSSGFVSAGTNDAPTERDAEWHTAQAEIESARRSKEEGNFAHQEGKTLYEVLQANKAAKQDAFEEAAKLRNQFRSLEEDEVEFLEEVLESTRREETEIKKQTREQLDAFKRQQLQADQALKEVDATEGGATDVASEETLSWGKGGKRRRKLEDKGLAFKKRKESDTSVREVGKGGAEIVGGGVAEGVDTGKRVTPTIDNGDDSFSSKPSPKAKSAQTESGKGDKAGEQKEVVKATAPTTTKAKTPVNLGLSGYSSEEDD